MILVTAAAGNQGKLLVPKLVAAGLSVRAAVQTEASAARLRAAGVDEVVAGDISEPGVLRRAIRGVRKVYHVGPTLHPREREMGVGLIDAARAEGVEHFVFSSVLHSIVTELVQHEIKRDIEEHLLGSDLEFTILQPSNYMLPLKLRPAFERSVFELSWSLARRQSLVDLHDVTDVAVMALTDSARHAAATYELVSPGRYTAFDLGASSPACSGGTIAVQGNRRRHLCDRLARRARPRQTRPTSSPFCGRSAPATAPTTSSATRTSWAGCCSASRRHSNSSSAVSGQPIRRRGDEPSATRSS